MHQFSVSVVIPLYNKAPFIRTALESVLTQTLAPHEVIIVDDGSTDGSAEKISDLLGGPVRLIRQANAGPGPARNCGVQAATGEWVALIDGDDFWFPDHLEGFAELTSTAPSADVLVNGHFGLPYGASLDGLDRGSDERGAWDFFASRGGVNSSCVAFRRSAFGEGFQPFCPGEDTDFWFRLALDHGYAKSHRKTAVYFSNTMGLMEAYDRTSATYELPGLFATINRSLDDPDYRRLRGKILFYRDCVLIRSIKLALYHGDRRRAREFIASLSPASLKKLGLYRALAWLPGPLVKNVAMMRNKLVTSRRQTANAG